MEFMCAESIEGMESTDNTEKGTKVSLGEIPDTLELKNIVYHLRSVIAFVTPASCTGIGHYIAYCRRFDGQWEAYNDLCAKVVSKKPAHCVIPHVLIFTI